jgi:quercetin dioxygenase-like cupin family protein
MKNKNFFPKKTSVGKRIWGNEDLLVIIPKKITLKKLTIKKGHKGGLQYHNKKNECGYLLSGKLLIRVDHGDGKLRRRILTKGQYFHFPPKTVHQEEALTRCVILEASTPHFNDRVRVEEKYGKKKIDGLPSTKIREIIFK